jgi:hypothetical protein
MEKGGYCSEESKTGMRRKIKTGMLDGREVLIRIAASHYCRNDVGLV